MQYMLLINESEEASAALDETLLRAPPSAGLLYIERWRERMAHER